MNMQQNQELFSIEQTSLSDLRRLLNREVSHLQTITDLAS